MYLPSHFEETDHTAKVALIARYPLGILITHDEDGLHADHIPFLYEATSETEGKLIGHVARRNDAWRRVDASREVLVVFEGPSAYVSPNWYPSKQVSHRVVPTYNYAVVHVYGALIVHEDAKWLRGVVGKLTKQMERGQPNPWKMADAPADYLDQMLAEIVGIEIPVSRMIGKWKVSQNRDEGDRDGAIAGLRANGTAEQIAMSELIAVKAGRA